MKKIFPPETEAYFSHFTQDSAWRDAKAILKIESIFRFEEQKKTAAYTVAFFSSFFGFCFYFGDMSFRDFSDLVFSIVPLSIVYSLVLRSRCNAYENKLFELTEKLKSKGFKVVINLDESSEKEPLELYKSDEPQS
jgi:hypothetical protein